MICYVINIKVIDERIFHQYLSTGEPSLSYQDREKILSFVFFKDQIRSLFSILLQNYVITKKYGLSSLTIQRTREVIISSLILLIYSLI
jgi:hypothetical protein